MALILEIRDRRGVASWHRLDGRTIAIGRALTNDVIVDDPYADGRHAMFEAGLDGSYVVRDLGSMNGTFTDGARVSSELAVRAGMELQLGRTVIRVRDDAEPVAAAVTETAQRLPRFVHWALTPRGSLIVMLVITLVMGYVGWAGSTDRSATSDTIATGLAGLGMLSLWAFIWGLATRGPDRRFRFRAHMIVVSIVVLAGLLINATSTWMAFLFPGATVIGALDTLIGVALLTALIMGHLVVAGSLRPRGRLYVALGVVAGFLGLAGLGTLMKDEEFTDVPTFSSEIKPVPGGRVPAMTIDELVAGMSDLKAKADEAAAK